MEADSPRSARRPSLHALSSEAWCRLEAILAQFENAWQRGERPDLDDYLTLDGPERRALLIELVLEDLEFRLKAGEPARAEDYLNRFPELAGDPQLREELRTVEAKFGRRLPSESTPPSAEADHRAASAAAGVPAGSHPASSTPSIEPMPTRVPPPAPAPPSGAFEPGDHHLTRDPLATRDESRATPDELHTTRDRVAPAGPQPAAQEAGAGVSLYVGTCPLQPGAEPLPGYRLDCRLGRGGFGEVWKAIGPGGIALALKFVPLRQHSSPVELQALEAIKNIRHVNLLALFGAWEVEGVLVIAMELADRTLYDRLQEAVQQSLAGIPRRELLKYSRETAAVLDYLNKPRHFLGGKRPVGIQHCDIKPQNLLLLGDGVKVADFGLARVLESQRGEHHGAMTPQYAPPEFFQGQASRHTDQYSLAVTYCHLRGSKLPFSGKTWTALRDDHLNREPDLSMLPEEERPAVARALAKDPTRRWPNCRSFVEALAESRPNSGPLGSELPPPPDPPRPARPESRPEFGSLGSEPLGSSGKDRGPMDLPNDWRELTDSQRRECQHIAEMYEWAWQATSAGERPPDLRAFLPRTPGPLRGLVLQRLIEIDLRARWQHRQPIYLEDYLTRYPELGSVRRLPLQLIHAEYRNRHLYYGDRPAVTAYDQRFPEQYPKLRQLVEEEGTLVRLEYTPVAPDAFVPSPGAMVSPSDSGVPATRGLDRAVGGGYKLINLIGKFLMGSRENEPGPVGGAYKLINLIGSGSHGEVWRAEAPGGVHVAIKIIRRNRSHEDAQRELQALELVKQLRHPFLLKVQAYWPRQDRLTIVVMDLADCSLRDKLKEYKLQGLNSIPPGDLVSYIHQAAEALDFLHEKNVHHQDIKPDNFLLLQGYAQVADLGLARFQVTQSIADATVMGTPAYMAPETWQCKIHPHGDQYSLAATYVELRLGRKLYDTKNIAALMMSVLNDDPDLTPLAQPEQEVLRRALAKKPDQRFGSCREFVQALTEVVPHAPRRASETIEVIKPTMEEQFKGSGSARSSGPRGSATAVNPDPESVGWKRWLGLAGALMLSLFCNVLALWVLGKGETDSNLLRRLLLFMPIIATGFLFLVGIRSWRRKRRALRRVSNPFQLRSLLWAK